MCETRSPLSNAARLTQPTTRRTYLRLSRFLGKNLGKKHPQNTVGTSTQVKVCIHQGQRTVGPA